MRLFTSLVLVVSWYGLPAAPSAQSYKLASCWQDLGSNDAAKAYRAMAGMFLEPDAAVTLLAKMRPPVKPADGPTIARWMDELGSDKFGVRDQARRKLEEQGVFARDALIKASKRELPLETLRRVEALLRRIEDARNDPEFVRNQRALEVLEQIGSQQAKRLLKQWVTGSAAAYLAKESAEMLQRLERRFDQPLARIKPQTHDVDGRPLPPGAIMRLGSSRFRDPAMDWNGEPLLFTPDGRQLLAVNKAGDKNLLCLDPRSGKIVTKRNGQAQHAL